MGILSILKNLFIVGLMLFSPTVVVGAIESPLKVVLLSGQSNMVGNGWCWEEGSFVFDRPKGLRDLAVDLELNDTFGKYWNFDTESPTIRSDVWVDIDLESSIVKSGNCTVGYGGSNVYTSLIGPELGMGWSLGDKFEEQVLLIKVAWGGKSLAVDFRPPSSGGTVGSFYSLLVYKLANMLPTIGERFPDYNPDLGYEIIGIGWHQGWNDYVNSDYIAEYEFNLANFIHDIRQDLNLGDVPFIVAESGMACYDESNQNAQNLCSAQKAVSNKTLHPELNNVGYVRAREFYSVANSPWDRYGYHWHGASYSYILVGEGMGDELYRVLQETTSSTTTTTTTVPPLPLCVEYSPGINIGLNATENDRDGYTEYKLTCKGEENKDQFRFDYWNLCGDGSINAKITNIQSSYSDSIVSGGIMLRENLQEGGKSVGIGITSNSTLFYFKRNTGQSLVTTTLIDNINLPIILKLEREDDKIFIYYEYFSSDNTLIYEELEIALDFSLEQDLFAGLYASSKTVGVESTVRFKNVVIN